MSKFTGLKKGIVGVCAATLLTGMMVAPAFAAVAGSVTGTVDVNDGAGGVAAADGVTNIGLDASQVDLQISATVPQKVTLAIDNTGALVLPTSDLTIQNGSTIVPLVLTTVTASTVADAPITLVKDAATLGAGELSLSITPTAGTAIDLKDGLSNGTIKIATSDSAAFKLDGKLGSINSTLLKSIADMNKTGVINFVDVTWTVAPDFA